MKRFVIPMIAALMPVAAGGAQAGGTFAIFQSSASYGQVSQGTDIFIDADLSGASRDFLLITNAGALATGVTVDVVDGAGTVIASWEGGDVAARAATSVAVDQIFADLSLVRAEAEYRLRVRSAMDGQVQYLVQNTVTGGVDNIGACQADAFDRSDDFAGNVLVTAAGGYQSTIHIYNEENRAGTPMLDLFNAETGASLGRVVTASVPAGGRISLTGAEVADLAGLSAADVAQLNIRLPGSDFDIQHVMRGADGFVDMSYGCEFDDDDRYDDDDRTDGSRTCTPAANDAQARATLTSQLIADGYQVTRIKTDDGCYEVDARDAYGRKYEIEVNPATLEILEIDRDD